MQLRTNFLNWLKINFFPSAYDDLEDLFIYLWWKIHRDGNTLRLIKFKWFQRDVFRSYTDALWKKLRDDYLDYFGLSDNYRKYLKLLIRLQILKTDLAVTGNRWNVGQIMIIEEKLNAMEKQGDSNDEYETLIDVQLALDGKIKIDPKRDSVIEYGAVERKAVKVIRQQKSEANARKNKRKK